MYGEMLKVRAEMAALGYHLDAIPIAVVPAPAAVMNEDSDGGSSSSSSSSSSDIICPDTSGVVSDFLSGRHGGPIERADHLAVVFSPCTDAGGAAMMTPPPAAAGHMAAHIIVLGEAAAQLQMAVESPY